MLAPVLNRHAARGFTLVELLIVVTIIGVLAVLAVTTYTKFIRRSRSSEAASNWRICGWQPSGPVYYQYDVVAGAAGDPGMPAGRGLDPTRPWFLATAVGDLDGNDVTSLFEMTSGRNTIYSDKDLE